jgi:hypothetical protein
MRFECAFVGGPRDGESELLPVNIGDDLPVRFDCHEGHYLLTSVRAGERWLPSYRYVADAENVTAETAL